MNYFELIKDRYSVRSFTDEVLTQSQIDIVLQAGHLAPTGCNYQPQRILVMNQEASLQKLKCCTKCHFNAPCAMLICYNKTECWQRRYDGELSGQIDATIVATHMALAAHNIGLGCCMVMHFDPNKIRSSFNLPEKLEPVLLLVMGHPSPDSKPLDLHNKYRDINEIVFYNEFN